MLVLRASLLLVLCYKGGRRGGAGALADVDHIAESSGDQDVGGQVQHQNQPASVNWSGAVFTLKVQVGDTSTRRTLSLARVEVYVNFTRTNSALTNQDGVVILQVPYQPGLPATLVASRERYTPAWLTWETIRMPIFTGLVVSLLSSNPGNICWFQDSVVITGQSQDTLSQARIQFPRSRLNLTDSNLFTVTVHLTTPQLTGGKHHYPTGLLSDNSGNSSVVLRPIAAVHAQLLYKGREVLVAGPIHITLPLGENPGPRTSRAVPAWCFNRTTGAWVNRGMGRVQMEEGKVFWSFTAPHLGYWIAAPLPLNGSYVEQTTLLEFISSHSASIMAVLGGTLTLIFGVFAVILCGFSEKKATRISHIERPLLRSDKTTTTYDNQLCEVSSQDSARSKDGSRRSLAATSSDVRSNDGPRQQLTATRSQSNDSASSKRGGDVHTYIVNEYVLGVESPRTWQPAQLVNRSVVLWPGGGPEQIRLPLSLDESVLLQDKLLQIHKQTVTVLPAPGLRSSPEPTSLVSQSALQPRTDGPNNPEQRQPMGFDNLSQTLPRDPLASRGLLQGQDREGGPEGPGEDPSTIKPGDEGLNYTCIPESVSVPRSLNETRVLGGRRPRGGRPFSAELQDTNGKTEQTLSEPRRPKPPSLTPRAWFVSLEGKPAAAICRNPSSLADSKIRRRAEGKSRETSLDSGVDMNEPSNQPVGVTRQTTLERSGTFVRRATSHVKPLLLVPADVADERGSGRGTVREHPPHGDLPGDDIGEL
ncbi:hypothetical protein DPEC_G00138560 [Dallia pectoralis]|uniref:Uncharacterized protein n=1 Tax=Dallia pectoralis TaxID=75939 RepID=A0ACC2GM06_DALPE|nr:hypothetical protein DPEC_G00138560 [Dallia pectoralis]